LRDDTKEDFKIDYTKNSIHILNASSLATASRLVLGEETSKMETQQVNFN
jgi:hypothetical protein